MQKGDQVWPLLQMKDAELQRLIRVWQKDILGIEPQRIAVSKAAEQSVRDLFMNSILEQADALLEKWGICYQEDKSYRGRWAHQSRIKHKTQFLYEKIKSIPYGGTESSFPKKAKEERVMNCVMATLLSIAFCKKHNIECFLGRSYEHVFCVIPLKEDKYIALDTAWPGYDVIQAKKKQKHKPHFQYLECEKPLRFMRYIPIQSTEMIIACMLRNYHYIYKGSTEVSRLAQRCANEIEESIPVHEPILKTEYKKQSLMRIMHGDFNIAAQITNRQDLAEEIKKNKYAIASYLKGERSGVGQVSATLKLLVELMSARLQVVEVRKEQKVFDEVIQLILSWK